MLLILNREIFIVVDEYVEREFGFGVVKIMFVYDLNDFEVGNCYELLRIIVMYEDGIMNKNVGKYDGLDCFVVRKEII